MSWQCPYCRHHSFLREQDVKKFEVTGLKHPVNKPATKLEGIQILCPNPKCQKVTLDLDFVEYFSGPEGHHEILNTLNEWPLLPASSAKPQPDYIPKPILEDYQEACAIRNLSPKASATLARRCLQGMIRDFYKVSGKTLFEEISQLEGKVDTDVWDAISAIRSVGNIGAHMEKDINIVVDVDPSEAQMLISLIEQLFDEWYVARHERQKRMAGVKELAEAKKYAKKIEVDAA